MRSVDFKYNHHVLPGILFTTKVLSIFKYKNSISIIILVQNITDRNETDLEKIVVSLAYTYRSCKISDI